MSIRAIILYLSFILLFSCQTEKETADIRTGDIIFVSDIQSELTRAINDVTQVSEAYQYTHMGIIEKWGDSLFVIHSAPENGVERITLQEFVCAVDSSKADYHVYRLDKEDIDFDQVVSQAKKYIGMPYNRSFVLSDTSQYCSELIFNAFEGYNVFTVEPMTFKNKSNGEYNPAWAAYFKERNEEVPEGALGCNPNGLSQNKNIKIIYRATCIGVDSVQFYSVLR